MGKVLIVEGERGHGSDMRDLLNEMGHEVELVNSGDAALTAFATEKFDVVILDMDRKEEMSGIAIMNTIQRFGMKCNAILLAKDVGDTCFDGVREAWSKVRAIVSLATTSHVEVAKLAKAFAARAEKQHVM